jgi:hypothetical protein
MQQNMTPIEPALKLNKVFAGQNNFRNVINANLQNPAMRFTKQFKVVAEVTKKDDKKITYKKTQEMMMMAPNSNFNFPIPLDGDAFVNGDYHLHMVAYAFKDDKGKYTDPKDEVTNKPQKYYSRWEFDRDFKITEAKELNAKDVTIKHSNLWMYLLLLAVLVVLALIILFIVWKRKKDKERAEREAHERKMAELQAQLDSLQGGSKRRDRK